MEHKWDYCGLCEKPFVRCGNCGNNCCSGTEECDQCSSAYEMQSNEDPPEFSDNYKKSKLKRHQSYLKEILDYEDKRIFDIMKGIADKDI